MSYQIEHIPQDRPATERERWGFAFEDFLADNWPYLVALAVILFLFFYARYRQRKRRDDR